MTAINLLPHRALARQRLRERWQRGLLMSVCAACALALPVCLHWRGQLADLHEALDAKQQQRQQAERAAHARRQDAGALQTLQARKALQDEQQRMQQAPARVLAALMHAVPAGVQLRDLRIDALADVLIDGVAVDAPTVQGFITALAREGVLQAVELVEVGPTQVEIAGTRARVEAFSVRARWVEATR